MEEQCFICGSPKYHIQMIPGNGPTSLNFCDDCQEIIESGVRMTVCKKVRIEVAHCIEGHNTCGKVHGHSIDIVVGITGLLDMSSGMVMDFKTIKEIIQKEVVDQFDHAYLNDTLPIPTAEYLAFYLYYNLVFAHCLALDFIRVHETENNYVEYRGDGLEDV